MVDLVAGAVAAVFVVVGVAIIAGPALPRWLRRGWAAYRPHRRLSLPRDDPQLAHYNDMHPTTQKAFMTAARINSLLRMLNLESEARDLRAAMQRIRTDEGTGLLAMQLVVRRLRRMVVQDPAEQRRLDSLVTELGQSVKDRSEQLELLPF